MSEPILKFRYTEPFTTVDTAVLLDETIGTYEKLTYVILCNLCQQY
jgi:hypothetical protein